MLILTSGCPVYAATWCGVQAQVRGNMFTHHQKTVIVDAPMHPGPLQGQARLHSAPALPQDRSLAQYDTPAQRQASSSGGGVLEASRRLVAFVGGLDLTEGRYDTHDHPLFATRQPGGPHEHDTYQGCLAGEPGGMDSLGAVRW